MAVDLAALSTENSVNLFCLDLKREHKEITDYLTERADHGNPNLQKKGELIFELFSCLENEHDVSVRLDRSENYCVIIRAENFVEASNGGYHIDIVLISRCVEDLAH